MKKPAKDAFFIDKFNYFIITLSIVSVIVISLVVYFVSSIIVQKTIQNDVRTQFLEVNKNIIKTNNKHIVPLTAGIIRKDEIVVVYRGEKIEFATDMPDDNTKLKEIELLVTKNENNNRAIKVNLYLNIKSRFITSYWYIYLIIFLAILAVVAFIAIMSMRFAKLNTYKFYHIVRDVKDCEKLGLEFNEIKRYEGSDEAGILSTQYNRILVELRKAYDKERQFVYDAAHELRVPLVRIESSLGNLEKKGFTEESRNIEKDHIKNCIYEAKALIDNMLDLTHEQIIVKEKTSTENMKEILSDVIESYKLIYADFTFNINLEDFEYQIRKADLVKLVNVLIDNAIKYSKDNRKEIDVILKKENESGTLSIRDYGVGMSQESQKHMFDIFWRADSSRAKDKGGIGMGLTIAKKLCERYQLRIYSNSVIDQGTTVSIDFK